MVPAGVACRVVAGVSGGVVEWLLGQGRGVGVHGHHIDAPGGQIVTGRAVLIRGAPGGAVTY